MTLVDRLNIIVLRLYRIRKKGVKMKKQRIGSANIAYQDVGKGHPLLMGHSFLWDAHMWSPQVDFLKSHYRCITPELWSHGQSDPLPHACYSIEALAEDYWQFAQALMLNQFALVGLSVGGMWAAHLALKYPKAVSALVLMDTFVGAEPTNTQKIYFGMMDALEANTQFTPELADSIAPFFFAKNSAKENPQLVNQFIDNLLQAPTQHIAGKIALGRAIFSRNSLMDKLAQIEVPTLIIVGEEDLPRPVYEAQAMAKLIPNAELCIIPKAGHICTLEQPKRVNDVLNIFLKKHI